MTRRHGHLLDLPVPVSKIAYNPTIVSPPGEPLVLAVRVESRASYWLDVASWDPEIWFYTWIADRWQQIVDAPRLVAAEDPSANWIRSRGKLQLVFGYVTLDRTTPSPTIVTRFQAVDRWQDIVPGDQFAEIRDQKDVRLCSLGDGRVFVCGRPQGGKYGPGTITAIILDSLADLISSNLNQAEIIPDLRSDSVQKSGTNQLLPLPDGRVGALGHLVTGSAGGSVQYRAATWIIDPETQRASLPRVIARASDFTSNVPKTAGLADVVFPGSLTEQGGQWQLYCGVGDSAVGVLDIDRPFAD